MGQLAPQQVTEEVKGNISLLRGRVGELLGKADIQANTTTALTTCCRDCRAIQYTNKKSTTTTTTTTYFLTHIYTSQQCPLCQFKFLSAAEDYPSAPSGYIIYTILGEKYNYRTNDTVSSYFIINSQQNQTSKSSCQQSAKDHPQGAPGYCQVRDGIGQPTKVYCDMERICCDVLYSTT